MRKAKKQQKHGWKYLLAGLVVLMFLVGAIIRWRARLLAESDAVDFLVEAGCEVTYDYTKGDVTIPFDASAIDEYSRAYGVSRHSLRIGMVSFEDMEVTPEMLRSVKRLTSIRAFTLCDVDLSDESWKLVLELDNVKNLRVSGSQFTDDRLAEIDRLSHLTDLAVWDTELSEASCQGIGSLSRLVDLDLSNVLIPQGSAAPLANLKNLESLSLMCFEEHPEITIADIQFVSGLTNLRDLTIWGCPLESDSWQYLRNLPRLKRLDIRHLTLGDSAVRYIADISSLESLSLMNTEVSGDVPLGLERLTRLWGLALTGESVDDQTLLQLHSLKHLKKIYIRSPNVTADGKAALKHALPDTEFLED